MPVAKRVESLKVVAELAASGEEFSYPLRDFLEGFYHAPRPDGLLEEPPLLAGKIPDGIRLDAYVAAVAEHFCRQYGYRPPRWIFAESRYLEEPWFGAQTHHLRVLLLMDSPSAFRVRNLFVSADALVRV